MLSNNIIPRKNIVSDMSRDIFYLSIYNTPTPEEFIYAKHTYYKIDTLGIPREEQQTWANYNYSAINSYITKNIRTITIIDLIYTTYLYKLLIIKDDVTIIKEVGKIHLPIIYNNDNNYDILIRNTGLYSIMHFKNSVKNELLAITQLKVLSIENIIHFLADKYKIYYYVEDTINNFTLIYKKPIVYTSQYLIKYETDKSLIFNSSIFTEKQLEDIYKNIYDDVPIDFVYYLVNIIRLQDLTICIFSNKNIGGCHDIDNLFCWMKPKSITSYNTILSLCSKPKKYKVDVIIENLTNITTINTLLLRVSGNTNARIVVKTQTPSFVLMCENIVYGMLCDSEYSEYVINMENIDCFTGNLYTIDFTHDIYYSGIKSATDLLSINSVGFSYVVKHIYKNLDILDLLNNYSSFYVDVPLVTTSTGGKYSKFYSDDNIIDYNLFYKISKTTYHNMLDHFIECLDQYPKNKKYYSDLLDKTKLEKFYVTHILPNLKIEFIYQKKYIDYKFYNEYNTFTFTNIDDSITDIINNAIPNALIYHPYQLNYYRHYINISEALHDIHVIHSTLNIDNPIQIDTILISYNDIDIYDKLPDNCIYASINSSKINRFYKNTIYFSDSYNDYFIIPILKVYYYFRKRYNIKNIYFISDVNSELLDYHLYMLLEQMVDRSVLKMGDSNNFICDNSVLDKLLENITCDFHKYFIDCVKLDNIPNTNAETLIKQFYNMELNKNKETHYKYIYRNFCEYSEKYLPKILDITDSVTCNSYLNCVLIEMRPLNSLKFIIKNCISKFLNTVSYTIVCGNLNYDFIKKIVEEWNFIKIIKIAEDNLTQNTYNNLLCSPEFWNMLSGERVLIYQDDSIIYKSNIHDFIEYDYIGAPWPENQCDNQKNVGNGGFSMRNRLLCQEICEKYPNTFPSICEKFSFSKNTLDFVSNNRLDTIPEDVYFSTIMIELGYNVPNIEKAKEFSCELLYSNNSLGGHCQWLYYLRNNIKYSFIIDFTKLYKCVAVCSPYNFTIGGGEKYLSYIMKTFIDMGYIVIFFNTTKISVCNDTIKYYLGESDSKNVIVSDWNILFTSIPEHCIFDYMVIMENSTLPEIKGFGRKASIYHCQFPFDYQLEHSNNIKSSILYTYDHIIVNSEFTKKWYQITTLNQFDRKIKIVYPPCGDTNIVCKVNKIENSYIMIGRIFPYNNMANNKYFDEAIKIFKTLPNKYTLYIIGSVKDVIYYNNLLALIGNSNNIQILADVADSVRNEYLAKSKYYLQLTGINDNNVCCQEHFGISLVEAIKYRCVPICYNGGFAPYIIRNNGYLFDSLDRLKNLILNINPNMLSELPPTIEHYSDTRFLTNFKNIITKCKTEFCLYDIELNYGSVLRECLYEYFSTIYSNIYIPEHFNIYDNLTGAFCLDKFRFRYNIYDMEVLLMNMNFNQPGVTDRFIDATSLVVLREPITRFIDHYYSFDYGNYTKNLCDLDHNTIITLINNFGNLMTLRISGNTQKYSDAVNNLEQITYILIYENIENDIYKLADCLSKKYKTQFNTQRFKHSLKQNNNRIIDQSDINFIKRYKSFFEDDTNLYNHGLNLQNRFKE
jgi:hypothetical protein